jgi:hypothetical protein
MEVDYNMLFQNHVHCKYVVQKHHLLGWLLRSQVPCRPQVCGNAEAVGTWGTIPTSSTRGGG